MRKIIIVLLLFCSSIKADEVGDLKNHIRTVVPSIQGWCSVEKALDFIDLVLKEKPKVYVEIGVFAGRSVFPVASALKYLGQGVIICIDPWNKLECLKQLTLKEDQPHLNWWSKTRFDEVYNSFTILSKRYGLEKYCRIIKTTAQKAVSEIDDSIDILYLDAIYSEPIALEIVQLYLPKVRSGGYIWINDALGGKVGASTAFILESCEHVNLFEYPNDSACNLFKKR